MVFKNNIEIFQLIIETILIPFGRGNIILVVVYGNYLRIKYAINTNLQKAISEDN